MIKKPYLLSAVFLAIAALLLTLVTATVVCVGAALNYFLPTIPLELACVVAGLAVLIWFNLVFGVIRCLQFIGPHALELDDDDSEDEESDEEFAEQIAEMVSAKLEPQFWKPHRPKARRR